jgi:hypothetical protein
MQKIILATATFMTLAAGSFGLAAAASAAPAGSSAQQTVDDLRTKGYDVRVNGTYNGPLTECSVGSVREVAGASEQAKTVYVDLDCQAGYQY